MDGYKRVNFCIDLNYRQIDFNGLVGYIGAYIGLFLGYSVLQMPDLFLSLFLSAKKYFGKIEVPNSNDLSGTQAIAIEEH